MRLKKTYSVFYVQVESAIDHVKRNKPSTHNKRDAMADYERLASQVGVDDRFHAVRLFGCSDKWEMIACQLLS